MKTLTQTINKKLTLSAVLAACLIAPQAHAELLGAGVGVGIWQAEPSGTAQLGDKFNVKNDTGLKSSDNNYIWAYFNHPIPLLPNIMLEHTGFSSTGNKNVNITFNDRTFSGNTKTKLELNQLDAIAYWGLPLPLIDINFGLGFKQLSGDLSMSSSGATESTKLDGTLPIGYLGAHFPIPALPITLSADTKIISYDGSSFSDTRFKGRWDILSAGVKLGVEAGYRVQNITIDGLDIDTKADLTIDGLFAGVTLVF